MKELPGASGNNLFGLTTADETSYHFWVCDEQEHKTWTNILKFLTIFPHSRLPVVPSYNPAELHDSFNPVLYNAGKQWAVLAGEEVINPKCFMVLMQTRYIVELIPI